MLTAVVMAEQLSNEQDAINKQTLREKVYDKLKAKIIAGDIFPGQNLTLRGLSEQFQVSIVPVREALFQLASEGVIDRRNNRDYRVSTLSHSEFKEIYRIRKLVEIYTAKRACILQPRSASTELQEILDLMVKSFQNPKEYIKYNQQFHFTLYSYAKMPIMMKTISGLWARIGPYFSINAEVVQDLSVSFDFHKKMYKSFIAQNESEVTGHLQRDIHVSYKILSPLIKKLQMNESIDFRNFILSKIL
jgi:DNA-binding GntR family transcriptional regulator